MAVFHPKIFLRESNEEDIKLKNKQHYSSSFKGDDARKAYEKIVDETSTVTSHSKTGENPKKEICRKQVQSKNEPQLQNQNLFSVIKQPSNVKINDILKAVEQNDLKFLQTHLDSKNVNLSDDYGWTPLMSAAYCGYLEIVKFLLLHGAEIRAKERSGLTAAQLALKKNFLNIVALLKSKRSSCYEKIQHNNIQPESLKSNILINDNEDCAPKETEIKEFYCEICKNKIHCTTVKKHESSVIHIFNTKPKLPNAAFMISKRNKGYQILVNNGWDEEGGLGPQGKGRKYPVKTYLKLDRKGIGNIQEKQYRITHFHAGDTNAVSNKGVKNQKPLRKKDREKLSNREIRKEKALRIALS